MLMSILKITKNLLRRICELIWKFRYSCAYCAIPVSKF